MHIMLAMVTAATIRKARAKLGESQAKFAERFGVNQSTVNRWEDKGPPNRPPIQVWIAAVLQQCNVMQDAA